MVLGFHTVRQRAGASPFPTSAHLKRGVLCLGRGSAVLRGIRCKAHSQMWDLISENNRASRDLG